MDDSESIQTLETSSNECQDSDYQDRDQDTPKSINMDSELELNMPITENYEVLDLSCKSKKESALHSGLNKKSENKEKKIINFFPQTSNNKHYKCKDCEFETTKLYELSLHLFFHVTGNKLKEPKPRSCLNCRFTTLYKHHAATHMIRHRNLKEGDMHTCKQCEYEVLYETSLKHHMPTHRSVKKPGWFQCEKCPYQSGYLNNLRKHVVHEHMDPKGEMSKCDHCEKESLEESNPKKSDT